MMWPEGMPQPPEGLRWEVAKSTGKYYRVSLVSKWGRTKGYGVFELPVGSRVESVDSEVVRIAGYTLREYNRKNDTTLEDAQSARVKNYGRWK